MTIQDLIARSGILTLQTTFKSHNFQFPFLVSQLLLPSLTRTRNTCGLNSAHTQNLACLLEVCQAAYDTICIFPKVQVQGSQSTSFRNTSFLWTSMYKNVLQALEVLQPYFKASKGISRTSLCRGILTRFAINFFSYNLLNVRKQRIYTDELHTRATFQVSSTKNSFFFGSQVAVFTSDPSCLKY